MGLGQRDEEVIGEVFDYGDGDGVAHGTVGFVVVGGELVGIGRSHEAGGFAGGEEAGVPFSGIVEEEELAAAASLGGAEAAGEIVEAELQDLLAMAGAAVAWEGGALVGRKLVEQEAVVRCDEGEKRLCPRLFENRSLPIDQIPQRLGALPGARDGPENDVIQGRDGPLHNLGVKPVRPLVFQRGGIEMIEGGDDEDAGAGLRNPMAGVQQHGADLVGALAEGMVKQAEIPSPVGGKQTDDVLQRDHGGLDRHLVENPQPFPEQAAAGGSETAHLPGEGEILAGETGPYDVTLRDLRAAHVLDGTGMEMPGSVVCGVDRGLARADVVGPDRGAGVLHALRDQAAAREEIDEGGKEWFQ